MFANAVQLTHFWTNAKDAYIRTMIFFMFAGGIVAILNSIVMILQRVGRFGF